MLTSAGHDCAPRWREGERLEQLFEQCCDELGRQGQSHALAVDGPDTRLTYAELDARANQLARFLIARQGVRAGDRTGLLFDRPATSYVGMLAVLKLRAVFVPLDASSPPHRLAYMASDAAVSVVLSESAVLDKVVDLAVDVAVLPVDELQGLVGMEDDGRLADHELGQPVGNLAT